MLYRIACCCVLVSLIAMLGGCAGPSAPDIGAVPVEGTVTYNGQAVADAVVTFAPASGGRAASGRTDASGKFVLTTQTAGDGALPGTYNVAVSKTEVASGGASTSGMSAEEADAAAYAARDAAGSDAEPKDLLPAKYKDAASSGLTAEVTEGGDNTFTFELTD